MARIDRFVFGYRRLKVSAEQLDAAASRLLRANIDSEMYSDGTIIVRERDYQKALGAFAEYIEYTASETRGIYGALKKIQYKGSLIITSVIMLIVLLFLSNVVWDIRVEGNEKITDARIINALSDNGLSIGKFWPSLDRSRVETDTLRSMDELSWININRRGAVAYVEVIEDDSADKPGDVSCYKFSNIISTADCVIEEITVISGVAVVKAGDVVKKGDLLISGVLTADNGICRAEGSVKGRMTDRVTVSLDRKCEEKFLQGEKLCSLTLNLFDFSINILKIYGNLTNECDIIEDVKDYSLLGDCKLPFSITREYKKSYSTKERSYTDSQLVELASKRLSSAVHSRLVSSELCKIRTYGDFTETGYTMYSDVVFLSEVGREVELVVD